MSSWEGGIFITWFGAFCSCWRLAMRGLPSSAWATLRFRLLGSRLIALSYGIGAALTLDEFALWLNLDAAAYWSREGRESIDAVILFGALLAIGTWGAPLFPQDRSAGVNGRSVSRIVFCLI